MVQLIISSSLHGPVFYQVIFIASAFHNTHCFKAALQSFKFHVHQINGHGTSSKSLFILLVKKNVKWKRKTI